MQMLDLIRMFSGEFTEVSSFISNEFWKHDVEDNAYASMRTDAGIVASIHSSATQWLHQFRLEIALDKGLIVLAGILSGSKSYGEETISVYEKLDEDRLSEETTKYTQDNSWRDEIAEFVSAIVDGRDILDGNSEDALKTMELVYQIYRADVLWATRYDL